MTNRKSEVRLMFKEVGNAIEEIRSKLLADKEWLKIFISLANKIDFLEDPWIENKFIYTIPTSIPTITRIISPVA